MHLTRCANVLLLCVFVLTCGQTPDARAQSDAGQQLSIHEQLKRGLIQPKRWFIEYMNICQDFDPATGEFVPGSWTDYEDITDAKMLDTILRVSTELVPTDEETDIIINTPDNIIANKKICALVHERSLTRDHLEVPTVNSRMGITKVDQILSLPNLEELNISWHAVSAEEVKKLVVLPNLRYLAYDDCSVAPNRADFPLYPGTEITCSDGNN